MMQWRDCTIHCKKSDLVVVSVEIVTVTVELMQWHSLSATDFTTNYSVDVHHTVCNNMIRNVESLSVNT